MIILRLLLLSLLFMGLHTVTLGGTRDPNTPDTKYVEFGRQFPAVQRFRATVTVPDEETKEPVLAFNYGSAVIIKPHWALTAAHMVEDAEHHTIIKDGKEYPLPYVLVYPDFEQNNFGFHDIALCYSETDFQLAFYSPLYDGLNEENQSITIAGYGFHGTFLSGGDSVDGQKRAGHNRIDRSERGVLICSPSKANRLPLEFMIAPGDSGGGMFIGNKLAGINSFLLATDKKPDGTYGDESAFTRVSLYVDWVESEIAKHGLKVQGKSTMASDVLDADALILPVHSAP